MAFKIAAGAVKKVWWPVDIPVPTDGGQAEVQRIDAQFEIINQSEADKLVYGSEEDDNRDLLVRVVAGLRQRKRKHDAEDEPIQDAEGNPLEPAVAKKLMLDVPYIRAALYSAYGKAAAGQGRVKNS